MCASSCIHPLLMTKAPLPLFIQCLLSYVYSENCLEEAGSLESQITRMQGKHLFFLRVSSFVFPGGRLSYFDRKILGVCAFADIDVVAAW